MRLVRGELMLAISAFVEIQPTRLDYCRHALLVLAPVFLIQLGRQTIGWTIRIWFI